MSDRPPVRALVAWFSPAFGVCGPPRKWPKCVSLAQAEDYARGGAVVIVDPFDLEDLTRHEQIERSYTPPIISSWPE